MAGFVFDPTLADQSNWRAAVNGDLPTSGVTAATYGDSTHVAQVAVNAQGIITGASNVAIAGGSGVTDVDGITGSVTLTAGSNVTITDNSPSAGDITIGVTSGTSGTGMVLLYSQTLSSAGATLDTGANGIAAGHSDLIIYFLVRSANAAATDTIRIRKNGDTGGNYDTTRIQNNNTTLSGATSLAATAWAETIAAASVAANYATALTLTFPAYDKTTFYKVGNLQAYTPDNTAGNNFTTQRGVVHRGTGAINQISAFCNSGANFEAGSYMAIYGTQ